MRDFTSRRNPLCESALTAVPLLDAAIGLAPPIAPLRPSSPAAGRFCAAGGIEATLGAFAKGSDGCLGGGPASSSQADLENTGISLTVSESRMSWSVFVAVLAFGSAVASFSGDAELDAAACMSMMPWLEVGIVPDFASLSGGRVCGGRGPGPVDAFGRAAAPGAAAVLPNAFADDASGSRGSGISADSGRASTPMQFMLMAPNASRKSR